ncbi:MAG: hypothetical protein LRY73_06545 [Bacillus sp. (in: Bacteria)]|nr:hypothetical protein [Bacillus sp. (in: firmicutes)]
MSTNQVHTVFTLIAIAAFFFIINLGVTIASAMDYSAGEEVNNPGVTSTVLLLIIAAALALSVYRKKRNSK